MTKEGIEALFKLVVAATGLFLYIAGFIALWNKDYMQAAALFFVPDCYWEHEVMEIKSSKRGGNARNRIAKGHLLRGRPLERKQGAMERAETYSHMTLDEKLKEQEPFKGKQYRKLLALKEKQNG